MGYQAVLVFALTIIFCFAVTSTSQSDNSYSEESPTKFNPQVKSHHYKEKGPDEDDEDDDDDHYHKSKKIALGIGLSVALVALIVIGICCFKCSFCPLYKWRQRRAVRKPARNTEAAPAQTTVTTIPNAPIYEQPPKYGTNVQPPSYYNGPPPQAQWQQNAYYSTTPPPQAQWKLYDEPYYNSVPAPQPTAPPPYSQEMSYPRDNAANQPIYETPDYGRMKS